MGVAGDDEPGFGGDGAGEDVIVVRIALDHRSGKCLRCDGLGQALVGLHELDSGDSGSAHALGELVRVMTSASSASSTKLVQRVILRSRAKSSRRRGAPCQRRPERTVFVSATIRIASKACGAGGFNLGLHVLRGYRRRVQRIELCEGFPEPSSGIVAVAFTAGLEEIHEVLDLGSLLRSE